jgi:hypothetical protein
MKPTNIAALAFAISLAGCASHSSNLRIGNDQSYASLTDQRVAMQSVTEYDSIPAGAKILGEIDAGRCHRMQGTIEPSENLVKTDLKVTAFAQGADGIANITFSKDSALTLNCWYILTGKATMFSVKKP